jgi:RNA polymerase sigma-70 factor, ECF subfamily
MNLAMPPESKGTKTRRAILEELFREFYRPIRNFFGKLGCGSEESADLAQDTFLRAYRSFEDFRGDSKPLTWLLSIATNLWRNHKRDASAAKRAGQEVALEAGEANPAPEDSSQDRLIDQERQQLLKSAIRKLPKQMRLCVLHRVYQDRSFREIADLLGVTEGTAKSQMSLAKPRLRSILAEHYPDLDALLDGREE